MIPALRSVGAVVLGIVGLATAAAAQTPARPPAIGLIQQGGASCSVNPRESSFVEGLRELGLVPGQSVVLHRRCHETADQLRAAAREIAGLGVEVIVAAAPVQASAAREATTAIPIVCVSCGDPVANGLTTSLARPSGNVTGLASLPPS